MLHEYKHKLQPLSNRKKYIYIKPTTVGSTGHLQKNAILLVVDPRQNVSIAAIPSPAYRIPSEV
jgi:hypothetical protein